MIESVLSLSKQGTKFRKKFEYKYIFVSARDDSHEQRGPDPIFDQTRSAINQTRLTATDPRLEEAHCSIYGAVDLGR